MSLPALDNLVRIGQLKAEPRNDAEVARLLTMARVRLADAELDTLSAEGRFSSAYKCRSRRRIGRAPVAWLPQRKSLHRLSISYAYARMAGAALACARCRAPQAQSRRVRGLRRVRGIGYRGTVCFGGGADRGCGQDDGTVVPVLNNRAAAARRSRLQAANSESPACRSERGVGEGRLDGDRSAL